MHLFFRPLGSADLLKTFLILLYMYVGAPIYKFRSSYVWFRELNLKAERHQKLCWETQRIDAGILKLWRETWVAFCLIWHLIQFGGRGLRVVFEGMHYFSSWLIMYGLFKSAIYLRGWVYEDIMVFFGSQNWCDYLLQKVVVYSIFEAEMQPPIGCPSWVGR